MTLPVDGVSGPTKAPGKHQVTFTGKQLAGLAPGQYILVIEASRETGGRELLRAPFAWPPAKAAKPGSAAGSTELGAFSVAAKP